MYFIDSIGVFVFLGQLYGLEKFWAFLKYYKNADKLEVQPTLKEYLKRFKTIEDFRVVEPEINEMLQGVGSLSRGRNFQRHRSVSESDGTKVIIAGNNRRPNTTITNRSDYVGNRVQHPQNQQHQQQQHHQQYQGGNNRRRTGSFGSGTVRVRSGSLGNKPQIANRNYHYGSRNDLRRSGGGSGSNTGLNQRNQQQRQQHPQQQYYQKQKINQTNQGKDNANKQQPIPSSSLEQQQQPNKKSTTASVAADK